MPYKSKLSKSQYNHEYLKTHRRAIYDKNNEWRRNNRDKARRYSKRYADKHPKEVQRSREKYRASHPGWHRKAHLKRAYSMTPEEYERRLKKQGGHCAFRGCTATEYQPGRGGKLAVEHNHKTKKVRGLVCHRHNALIGFAQDSIEELEAAIDYLKKDGR